MFISGKCTLNDETAQITAVQISSRASADATGYGYKNTILPLVSSFCM